jgi:hypothetical protein
MRNTAISILLIVTLMGLGTTCSRRPSDEAIGKDVQDKVATDPETKDSQISVEAKQGQVKLTGKVKTPAAEQKVEQIAREEPGTTSVDDETAVDTETSVPGGAATAGPAAAVEKPKPQPIVIPAGTVLTVRTIQGLSSKTSQEGQTFGATLAQPVSVGEKTALPRRSEGHRPSRKC